MQISSHAVYIVAQVMGEGACRRAEESSVSRNDTRGRQKDSRLETRQLVISVKLRHYRTLIFHSCLVLVMAEKQILYMYRDAEWQMRIQLLSKNVVYV